MRSPRRGTTFWRPVYSTEQFEDWFEPLPADVTGKVVLELGWGAACSPISLVGTR
jgi:hypothetical protein